MTKVCVWEANTSRRVRLGVLRFSEVGEKHPVVQLAPPLGVEHVPALGVVAVEQRARRALRVGGAAALSAPELACNAAKSRIPFSECVQRVLIGPFRGRRAPTPE